VYFGVDGESSHYVLETDIASEQTNGNLTLDLVPAHYVPGYYQLVVSLGDAAKNVSAAASF
jgi:hypothetical protein